MSKLTTLEDAAASIPDGSTVAIGGLSMNSAPMALVRELVRQGKRDLTLVAIVASMPADWLIGGGCVRRIVSGLVSFEGLGLAPSFRAMVQSGAVAIEEYSEHLLIARLQAQAHDLPFVPTKAGLGTDVLELHRESGTIREEIDETTGQRYVACTPLAVDVAIVHAHEADPLGNVRVDPKLIWMDNEIVNAAERTIVTVERIASHDSFVAEPHRTTYPRFMVSAVAEAPYGAFPTSLFPEYTHHSQFFVDYAGAARDPDSFREYFAKQVLEPESWQAFLDANGGAPALVGIRRSAG